MIFKPFSSRALNEIFLHIGLHKTGSTSIQETLYMNRDILEERSFLYPKCFPSNHSVPMYSAFCDSPENYYMNIRHQRGTEQVKEFNKQNLMNLEKEIYASKAKKLIISAEELSVLPKANLARLKKYLKKYSKKIKVIIFVRNPVSWGASLMQEKIKGGATYESAFESTLNELRTLYKTRVGNSLKLFKNVEVIKFEDAIQHEKGLVGHFLSSIGFDTDEIEMFKQVRINESISNLAADIMSYINSKIPIFLDGKLHPERKEGDLWPLCGIRGEKFNIPYELKKQFYDASLEDILWLKKRVGIDYTDTKLSKDDNPQVLFSKEALIDIKQAYFGLTDPLKEKVLEYLELQNNNYLVKDLLMDLTFSYNTNNPKRTTLSN